MHDHFGSLLLRQAGIHRPIEMIRRVHDLTGRDKRAYGHETSITWRKVRAQPKVAEQDVSGMLNEPRRGTAELLPDT